MSRHLSVLALAAAFSIPAAALEPLPGSDFTAAGLSPRRGPALELPVAVSEPPADPLEACPKLGAFSADGTYSETSNLKDVAEIPGDALPLPADDMDRAGLLAALSDSLAYWEAKPDAFTILVGKDRYAAAQMRRTTQKLLDVLSAGHTPAGLRDILKNQFRIYRSVADDGSGRVVITGYYEAEIKVSREPDAVSKHPVYLKPADLVKTTPQMGVDFDYGRYDENGKLVKYHSRGEITAGALGGRGLELAWSAHPSRVMLLQIQGSGILRFADGSFVKAGFDGANGHPFKSVQKLLMDCGEIPAMSFKDFIAYLSKQGDREARLVDLNPRYIFFKTRPADSPAYGAMGSGLTPGRSVAVDPRPIPLGVTALMVSKRPVAGPGGNLTFADFTRFVAAHDTGSAIRGPGRIDLFWGAGANAETEASSMKAPGDLYILIAK